MSVKKEERSGLGSLDHEKNRAVLTQENKLAEQCKAHD